VIALVHGLRNWGAVEEYVAAVARGLVERGDDVVLVHPDDPVLSPFDSLGVRTLPFDLDSATLLPRLVSMLRGLRPDVVHVTEVFPQGLIAGRLSRPKRLLLTHHTPELPRSDNLAGRVWSRLGWATRPEVIYTSESDRRGDGRTDLRTHVVSLGIDLDRFAHGRAVLDGRIVGNVARLAEQKGHRTLVEAAAIVRERHPDVRFVVAGDGELLGELEALAAPLGDGFSFLGARDDVPDLLASFEVFAFPSRFEGLCVSVIEAQASGVPVVATPVGGIRETVVEGETGWLVPVDDAAALAERISWVLEHPAEARPVADEARRRARGRFSIETMVERTLALYGVIR
jgi:glycosyltransferase involved in cell wall biosynthesis